MSKDKNIRISIADRIEAFVVKKPFKIGKVKFEEGTVYNKIDLYEGDGSFINFVYEGSELKSVNEVSLSKFRKNYKRIKNYISILDYNETESNEPKNEAIDFDTVAEVTLLEDLNGLDAGWVFTRNSKDDLFTNSRCNWLYNKDFTIREKEQLSYSFDQKAAEELYTKGFIRIDATFEQVKQLEKERSESEKITCDNVDNIYNGIQNGIKEDTVIDVIRKYDGVLDGYINHIKELKETISKLEEDKATWKMEYISKTNDLQCRCDDMKERFLNVVKKSDRYKRTVESLLEQYQTRLDNIDIIDELEFDKVEEGTVLENMVTVLKHLNKMI